MIKKVYLAQEMKPVKKDWYLMIMEEKQKYKIELSGVEIQNMSKGKFKNLVNESVDKIAFNSLIETARSHSKS